METLCRNIRLPEEVTAQVLRLCSLPGFYPDLSKLMKEETWQEGLSQVQQALGEDPGGFKLLACMLRCALEAREHYNRLGLPDPIYEDTFACFSRFVREHKESYGSYGFDRGFWTVRQISCKLFRIGELEYELTQREGNPAISLHIPSDAILDPSLLQQSWLDARSLLGRIFPEYENAPMFCRSWLLSPTLTHLLPPQSRILSFQKAFHITPLAASTGGYVLWVFKDPRLLPEQYPESTSLQRSLKAWILSGGTFTDAIGILKESPFLPEAESR